MNMRDPSWDLYRSFLAVLEEGSLSGAARALGLTQPTLARHVESLEEAIGRALFIRSQRGLVPTDAARELAPYAETIASTAAALLRTATGHGQEVAGTVRVSAADVVGVEILPRILAGLRERHSGLVIELALSNEVDDLLRHESDIAVRMVAPRQEALVAMRIGEIPLGFHAHRGYLERHGTPQTLDELRRHAIIGYDRETPDISAVLARAPELRDAPFALKADNQLAQLAAIRAGFGIGICQTPIAARDPDLVPVLPGVLDVALETWLVMHENLRTTPRCRAVFDALAEGLRRHVRR